MKTILENIQQRLSEITDLKYIDENWGQIDYYATSHPVQWPVALIDITNADFSNMGQSPEYATRNRQNAELQITIIIANLKLNNTSFRAPQNQKDNAWNIWKLMEDTHHKLHGYCPSENAGKMIRKSMNRVLRDDGIQEYHITYAASLTNC